MHTHQGNLEFSGYIAIADFLVLEGSLAHRNRS